MADDSYNVDLNIINYSYYNYDSTNAPFFRRSINYDISENNSTSLLDHNNIELIYKFKCLEMNKDINDFFINHQAFNKEIYINNITFISITKILELVKIYRNDDINNIIDIGFIYEGMGHIIAIYYNTKFNKLFLRSDGGSNGYDRLDNYNKMKKISKINNIELLYSKAYNLNEILNL